MNHVKHNIGDLEKEIDMISRDAVDEEQDNANRNYGAFDNELQDIEKRIPYPNTAKYDVGFDYDDIERIQCEKHCNEPYWRQRDELLPYCQKGNLYVGHLYVDNVNYYIIDSHILGTKKLEVDREDVWFINSDDRNFSNYVKWWRYPGENRNVQFSRNITLQNRRVRNVDIVLDRADELFSSITDEYLRNALKRNKRQKGVQSIIQTIQDKQDTIRSLPKERSFIVQGCAGSGKTMVLLHRIRYLLFNEEIKSKEYLYLVPGDNYKTFIEDSAFSKFNIERKNILTYQECYQQYDVIYYQQKVGEVGNRANELVFNPDYLKRVYSKDFIQEVYSDLFDLIMHQAETFINFYDSRKNKWFKRKKARKEFGTRLIELKNKIDHIYNNRKNYIDELKPAYEDFQEIFIDIINLNIELTQYISYEDEKWLKNKTSKFFFSKKTDKEIYNQLHTLIFNKCKKIIFEEYAVKISQAYKHYWYLKLYCRFLTRKPEETEKTKFIFIDEAQDLSVSEIELIKKINTVDSNEPTMNLFGDTKQVITEHSIKQWEEIDRTFELYFLEENFRNTNQIVEYCNRTLNMNMTKIGIDMEDVKEFASINDAFNVTNNSKKDVIFIVKDDYAKKDLLNILSKKIIENYEVFTVRDVKGLEFEEVYVFDKNMSQNEKYISYTRALAQLYVIKELPATADRNESLIIQGTDDDDEEFTD